MPVEIQEKTFIHICVLVPKKDWPELRKQIQIHAKAHFDGEFALLGNFLEQIYDRAIRVGY